MKDHAFQTLPGTIHRAAVSRSVRLVIPLVVSALAWGWIPFQRAQTPNDLAGDWMVDLRPTTQAPAYIKPMRLSVGADNSLAGEFYESSIASGRADASKGRTCFAFTTRDGSGPYQTAGCLVGDRIEGQTWSEGRGFLLTWTATRPPR